VSTWTRGTLPVSGPRPMVCLLGSLLLSALLAAATASAQRPSSPVTIPEGLPPWAFNLPDPVQPPIEPITGIVRVPGSTKEYDAAAVADSTSPPDWFPAEHPVPPQVVAGPMQGACGSCHLMSGQGHPESADIAALPVEYFVRQMEDFRSGARQEENRMGPIARALSDEDIRLAAEYFAAVKPISFVDVIETATPPKTYVSVVARHRVLSPEGGTEPIGRRIVQIPKDPRRTTIRDPHSGFIAYVPLGSVARGEALVNTGSDGTTVPCGTCHGETLRGAGDVPRLAGLQPVYTARQLFFMQKGANVGPNVALMQPVVAKLSEDDIIAISAYLGSLPPR
jgi:cytochrome c553